MSLEQLEAVSMDESIAVPDGFAIRLKENLGAAETIGLLTENESGSQSAGKIARYAAAAASVAILAGAGWASQDGRVSRRTHLTTHTWLMPSWKEHLPQCQEGCRRPLPWQKSQRQPWIKSYQYLNNR